MSKRRRPYTDKEVRVMEEEAERVIVGNLRKKCCPSLADVLAMAHAVQPPPPESVVLVMPVSRDGTTTKRTRKAFAEILKRMDAPLPSSRPCARLSPRTDRKP